MRWEYKYHKWQTQPEERERELNLLGAHGWELVSTDGRYWAYFKRPIGDEPTPEQRAHEWTERFARPVVSGSRDF